MERDQYPLPHIEVTDVSESVRIYSTPYVGDSMVEYVVSGILSHPDIESATPTVGEPTFEIMITVSRPEYWNNYIDPHCREVIGMAMEAQNP
jgi:hypothetical protein